MIEIVSDPFPGDMDLRALWLSAWEDFGPDSFAPILARGIGHVGAYENDQLVGFVNVAWDGGVHAFILDTTVHKDFQRLGIATKLLYRATEIARDRGAHWLHVDFEPHLTTLYRAAGFGPTAAGLKRLR